MNLCFQVYECKLYTSIIVGIDDILGRGCKANNERNASVSTSYLKRLIRIQKILSCKKSIGEWDRILNKKKNASTCMVGTM